MTPPLSAADTPLSSSSARRLTPLVLSVVVPAYNEAARLTRTLRASTIYLETRRQNRGDDWELLIVDDGSHDETVRVARNWADAQTETIGSRVRVLRYEQNRGKGYAVRFGILQASEKSTHVLFMDADLATPIEEIEKLLDALTPQTPVAIGSRPLADSELLVRQPLWRETLGRAFNQAVQLAATPGIKDTQCGFKLMTRDAARAIFSRCVLNGFSFDVEMLFVARKLGFGIAEVPVRWAHQEGAAAFATKGAYLRHGIKMVADLFRIRWAHRAVSPTLLTSLSSVPPVPPRSAA